VGTDADDLRRAFDFVLRADMFGTEVVPWRHGLSVRAPEVPLRHDSNYLLVEPVPPPARIDALVAEADEVAKAAGHRHRLLMFRDAEAGERLAPGFAERGWEVQRGLVMAHRRAPVREMDLGLVTRTEPEALLAVRTADILRYPWGTPEVARQLLAARGHSPVPTQVWAVFEDGAPVSWAELYLEGGVGQVEAVATVEAFRNRGFASAVVLRCIAEARRAGADLVFLCAQADDWPKDLYVRLGFDAIGRYVKFTLHRAP
jgi:GNAT superfamily N-acetyltransferase